MMRLFAITPARDEEKLLPKLIRLDGVAELTPDRWIIIERRFRRRDACDYSTGRPLVSLD